MPGEPLHIDIKKLDRFDKVDHRITGDRTQGARNVGWEYVFVAVDDLSRIAFTKTYSDKKQASAVDFVRQAARYFDALHVPIQHAAAGPAPPPST
ncbi:hypothetical protein M8A51_22400 [Schlegelella sp. S2-27]|uniref:Integrase core domain-containing protein n=1 Tax=Caldimonas mangrovi TaxID=2944811 RepID=A0ABT0YV55_9BURK|nr:hypothetical protein [Caldimonas mangrovi]MCM5682289.1 hypothetical protein [Caldimonas mangrovi]